MKFQLCREGAILGQFTLDEMRHGRASGQFDGWELVWREATSDWQPIDEFIQAQERLPRTTPPPIPLTPAQKQKRAMFWVLGLVAVLFVGGVVVVGLGVLKFVQRVRQLSGTSSRVEASAAAAKPVLVSSNAVTQADGRERKREFRARQWIAGYQQNADHSSACDAECRDYLEAWLEANYGSGGRTNRSSVREQGDRLATRAECGDPLVLTLAGIEATETRDAIDRLELALRYFPGSRHKAYPHFYAAVSLADKLDQQPERVAALDTLAIAQLRECFTDGSFQTNDVAEIADLLINGWGQAFFRRNGIPVPALVPAGKNPDWEWLSFVLAGEHHIREAWRARGGGYADTVTAEGWRKFSSELAEARQCLTQAWHLRPGLPLAPARMIYVSLGSSGITEMRLWFDRAVTAQLDYPRAWSDLRWGLRPRWHGDLDAMRDFGITALNTARFDTDVPRMLFDSISDIESEMELSPREHIYGREDVWPHLQRMYEGYLAEPSQARLNRGWRTTYTIVAFLAGKHDVARAQLTALDWQLQPGNQDSWGTDLSLMLPEVAARTGPLATEIIGAETLRDTGEWGKALDTGRALAKDARADERTQEFIRHRVAMLEIEDRLHRGEWVDFLPRRDDDPAWRRHRGSYRVLPDGAVEVTPARYGHLLVCRAWVGSEFEVRGEYEPVNSATGKFQAGLVLGLPNLSNYDWLAFRLKHGAGDSQFASYSQGWTSRHRQKRVNLNETRNTFTFRFEDGAVRSTVNGQPAHQNVSAPATVKYSPDEFLVGLGAWDEANHAVIRYRNVQVRLLPATNTPAHRP